MSFFVFPFYDCEVSADCYEASCEATACFPFAPPFDPPCPSCGESLDMCVCALLD